MARRVRLRILATTPALWTTKECSRIRPAEHVALERLAALAGPLQALARYKRSILAQTHNEALLRLEVVSNREANPLKRQPVVFP